MRQLSKYSPYPKQAEFHAAGKAFRERMFCAGNQLGKCNTVSSRIELPNGLVNTFGEMCGHGRPFDVYAWDGHRVIVSKAIELIKKPPEPCVRLWLSSGKWIEVARRHRVMSACGEYVFCDSLLASLPILHETNSGYDQPAHGANDRHWSGILEGFLADCLAGLRLCDERLRIAANNALEFSRQSGGVLLPDSVSCASGGCLSTNTNTYRPGYDRLSSLDASHPIVGRCAAFLGQVAYKCARRMTKSIQVAQRLVVGSIVRLQSGGEEIQSQEVGALFDPFGKGGNQIIAYEVIPSQEVYDFTVPETANYITAGIIHHNTLSAGAEMAIHLTGRYPDWWQGYVYDHPIKAWASGITGESTRDNPQRILYGQLGRIGTGMIPKECLKEVTNRRGTPNAVDTILVKWGGGGDVQARESFLGFKSNDQGREKWQGETLDLVWFDEEHDEDVYTEGLTRTNVAMGLTMLTFTPLKGMSSVVKRFLLDKVPGTHTTIMTIDDVLHYTAEQRAAIIASYPAHEREARARGTPTMGSGRVFPIEEDYIVCDPFEIPAHWTQLCGIDFGWDHPSAGARLAWDRDNDILYVIAAHRAREQTPAMFAAAVKPWGEWLKWAWPHDGLQHDKGSGEQLAHQYRQQGLNMLPERAKFEDGSNGLEAGITEMLDRMQTGRLKVFRHLNEWIEEFRLYHRKDGLIVKSNDDLLSATRYAMMMRRFSTTKIKKARQMDHQSHGWAG